MASRPRPPRRQLQAALGTFLLFLVLAAGVNVREPSVTLGSAPKKPMAKFTILSLDIPKPVTASPSVPTMKAKLQKKWKLLGAAKALRGKPDDFKEDDDDSGLSRDILPEWLERDGWLVPSNSSQWLGRNLKPMKRLTNLTLSWPYGQLCNQLLSLSAAIARAMKHKAVLYLYGPWTSLVEELLDVEILKRADVRLLHEPNAPESTPVFNSYLAVWCASRATVNAVRDVIRPSEKIRTVADRQISQLKADGASTIVSVHLRDMDGLCGPISGLRPCHRKALYDADWTKVDLPDEVCRYRMSPRLFSLLQSEWPKMDWGKESLGFYLSSDGHIKESEATFFNTSLRPANVRQALLGKFPHGVVNDSRRVEAYMLSDMWASAQSEYYLANPMSSCDSIVAQWRSEFLPFSLLETRQSPRTCFDAFRLYPEPERDVCDVIKRIALDNLVNLTSCERVLALGSALVKAHRTGYSLVLTGVWKAWVQSELDVNLLLEKSGVDIEFVEVRPKTRYNVVYPERWRAVALNSTREYLCARGKFLDVVAKAVRPAKCSSKRLRALPLTTSTESKDPCDAAAKSFEAPLWSLDKLCSEIQGNEAPLVSASNACGQVLAHWRSIQPRGCSSALRRDDEAIVETSKDNRFVCGGWLPDKDPVKRPAQERHQPNPVDLFR